MHLRMAGYVLGGVILAVGVADYARVVLHERTRYREPLKVPISLVPGKRVSFDVPVSTTRAYDIVVEANTFELLQSGHDVQTLIEWRLWDAGSLLSEGNSSNQPGTDWWGTYEQPLGRFTGQAGHDYQLELHEESASASFASANPVLKVQIPRDDWEGYLAGEAFKKIAAFLVGALGVLIIGVTLISSKVPSKRNILDHSASTLS